jgi:AAA15 family ATPase/GTPase
MLPLFEAYRKYDCPEKLKNELYDREKTRLTELNHLRKVNILVGPNNSGKSLLLRELIKTRSHFYYGQDRWEEISEILTLINEVPSAITQASGFHNFLKLSDVHSGDIVDLRTFSNPYPNLSRYAPNYDVAGPIQFLSTTLADREFKFSETRTYSFTNQENVNTQFNTNTHQEPLSKIFDSLNKAKEKAKFAVARLHELALPQTLKESKRVYIPTFRTLKEFKDSQIHLSIQKEYGFDNSIEIYTGQSFPQAVENYKNNEYPYRRKIEAFEQFLEKTFFQNQKVTLAFHKVLRVLLIKIGDEKDRPIYELGDGLQMLIILTFPFFMYSSGVIGIEEPELFIHPGLQKELMKFLTDDPRTKNWQIFLTTHSNHILDSVNLSSEVSIFAISKGQKKGESFLEDEQVPDFIVDNLAHGDRNALTLLGVTNTSVYLSNCVIWVEGITDKLYLQKYIDSYFETSRSKDKYPSFRNLKEGIHYSFALSGGDNIIHWNFDEESNYEDNASRIIVHKFCSRSFVIVDSDFGKNSERKKKLSEVLNGRVIELQYPEMENLLPPDVLPNILHEYKSIKKAVKADQLPVLGEEELIEHKIGYLIDNVVLKSYPTCKKFSSDSGSIKSTDKYEFCINALKYVDGLTITDYTCGVVERLLDFIIAMNNL